MDKTDKTLDLLKILANLGKSGTPDLGLRVVTVKTADPYNVTLVMAGVDAALDLDIFEMPVDFYPLRAGDRLLAYPLVSASGGRWGLIAKLNGGLVMATMQGPASCQPDGSEASYQVTVPYGMVLQAGDRVAIAPTWDGSQVAYTVLSRY